MEKLKININEIDLEPQPRFQDIKIYHKTAV